MVVIPLETDHIDAVAKLEAALFERPFTAMSLASLFAGKAFAGYALIDDRAEAGTADSGHILSYILLSQVPDEAEILSLGTRHTHQVKGYGRQLLTASCAALAQAGIGHLYLDVAESNVAARALYGGCGFVETGRRAAYYGVAPHRQDAIIMSKALK
ncbi:MAG: GNAT family N-acetyltransferase [Candidatus Puniceispirillum sp.]